MIDKQSSENLWNIKEEHQAAQLLQEVSTEEKFWIPEREAAAIIRKWGRSLVEAAA